MESVFDFKQKLIIAQTMQKEASELLKIYYKFNNKKEVTIDEMITDCANIKEKLIENFMDKYYD